MSETTTPAAEVTLRKHQCIPFLDTSKTSTANWVRIDKSTIFELNPNPQTTTEDYICYESPVTVIDHYEPELPQEIVMNENNPCYDFIFEKFFDLPVGEACKVPLLICFPGEDKKAWRVNDNMIVLGNMNTVDKKISFTLKLGGNIDKGTYTITSGVPTFTLPSSEG